MPSRSRSPLVSYGSAVASIALATWLRLLLDPALGSTYPYGTLSFAVLVVAWFAGIGPAMFAVAVGVVAAGYFLIEPRGAFATPDSTELAGMGLYIATGVGIAILGGGMRSAVRRAESELLKRLSQLRRSVENAPGATAMFDTEMRYLVTSARWRTDFGLEGVPLIGRSHYDVFPEVPESWKESHRRCLAGATEKNDGEAFVRTDGTTQWLRWEVRPWRHERVIGGLVMYCEDITPRKQAEEALRTSEERMRVLVEGAKDYAIYLLDERGTIITWNAGAERILGYSADEVIGQNFSRFYSSIDLENDVPKRELQLAATNGRLEDEGWRIRKDGSRFWADGVLSALMNGGTVRGFARVVRDVTERRHTEELLRSVLYNALDGIASIDADGRIQSFNRAGERLFGYAAADVVGQPVTMLIPETTPGELEANFFAPAHATPTHTASGADLRGRRKDGTMFPLEMAVTEFRLDNERHFTAVLRDLTSRHKLQDQLRQSQKLEAFGQLAGGVAHDFNNLLTVIAGDSESLLADLSPEDPNRALVTDIRDAGTRATSLTRQLLAFSRRQVLEPKRTDLNEVLSNTQKMLQRIIGEDIELSSVLDPHLSAVMVDPGQIEQVILNLAVNARDAMPRGGKLTIETRNVAWLEPPPGADAEWRPGQYAMFSMSDDGVGMTPEVRARVFEPFFTTKGPGKGTGLGLATVFGIIKQSDGFTTVHTAPGAGTSFRIYLPAVAGTADKAGARTAAKKATGGFETILLVEDEEIVRKVAQRILSARGYSVVEAHNGEAALKAFDTHKGTIHLVITDVVMPEMSGRQLAEAVRSRRADARVLFMSGYTDDAVMRHGIVHEREAFIQKPFSPDSLARKVRDVLDSPL